MHCSIPSPPRSPAYNALPPRHHLQPRNARPAGQLKDPGDPALLAGTGGPGTATPHIRTSSLCLAATAQWRSGLPLVGDVELEREEMVRVRKLGLGREGARMDGGAGDTRARGMVWLGGGAVMEER